MNIRENPIPRPPAPPGVRRLTIASRDLAGLITGRLRIACAALPADFAIIDVQRNGVTGTITLFVASVAFTLVIPVPDVGPFAIVSVTANAYPEPTISFGPASSRTWRDRAMSEPML